MLGQRFSALLCAFSCSLYASTAQATNCELMFNLGMFDDAITLCEKESQRGSSKASVFLSSIYNDRQQTDKAIKWLRTAHDQGSVSATHDLAYAYEHGIGPLSKDVAKAKDLYDIAAGAGYAPAQHALSRLLDDASPETALSAMTDAAIGGYPPAQVRLAQYFMVNGDADKAVPWLQKAQATGNADAMFLLGVYYSERNPQEARRWYERALEQQHPQAAHNLADMYIRGSGGQADTEKARSLLHMAAASGVTKSQALLSQLTQMSEPPSAGQETRSAPPAAQAAQTSQPADASVAVKPASASTTPAPASVSTKAKAASLAVTDNEHFRSRDWVFSQAGSAFALQLASFSSTRSAEAFISRNQLQGDSFYYASKHRGKDIYIVLRGPYAERRIAQAALQAMPPAVRKSGPFLKSFASIQRKRQY